MMRRCSCMAMVREERRVRKRSGAEAAVAAEAAVSPEPARRRVSVSFVAVFHRTHRSFMAVMKSVPLTSSSTFTNDPAPGVHVK